MTDHRPGTSGPPPRARPPAGEGGAEAVRPPGAARPRPEGRAPAGPRPPDGRRPRGGRRPREGERPGRPRPRRRPRLPGRLTGRAAVLVLAVCALGLALVVPTRQYLAERSRLNAVRAQTQRQEAQVRQLEQLAQAWHDPAYVRAQARARLHYVDPGETPYVVIPPSSVPSAPAAAGGATPHVAGAALQPWYGRLLGSIEQDAAPAPARATAGDTVPAPSARPVPRATIGPAPTATPTRAAHPRARKPKTPRAHPATATPAERP